MHVCVCLCALCFCVHAQSLSVDVDWKSMPVATCIWSIKLRLIVCDVIKRGEQRPAKTGARERAGESEMHHKSIHDIKNARDNSIPLFRYECEPGRESRRAHANDSILLTYFFLSFDYMPFFPLYIPIYELRECEYNSRNKQANVCANELLRSANDVNVVCVHGRPDNIAHSSIWKAIRTASHTYNECHSVHWETYERVYLVSYVQ